MRRNAEIVVRLRLLEENVRLRAVLAVDLVAALVTQVDLNVVRHN